MKFDESAEPTLTDLMVAMKEGFSAVDKRLDAIGGHLDTHDGLLATLVERADTTDARIGEIKSSVVKIEKHLLDIEDKIDTLSVVVDKDSLSIVQHEGRITALEQRV